MALPILHQRAATSRPAGRRDLRVVTWNLEFAQLTMRAVRLLGTHPRLDSADVLLLQEMDERGTAEIADELGVSYAYVAASVHPKSDRNFGNAVLSPWPLADVDVIHLPYVAPVSGQPRVALGVSVEHERGPIRVFCTHTEIPVLSRRKRLAQFLAIADAVDRWPDVPLIVGGDFNTATEKSLDAVTEALAERGLTRVSAGAGPTMRRAGASFHLDHLFARGLQPLRVGTVLDHETSDHHPLWAELAPDSP